MHTPLSRVVALAAAVVAGATAFAGPAAAVEMPVPSGSSAPSVVRSASVGAREFLARTHVEFASGSARLTRAMRADIRALEGEVPDSATDIRVRISSHELRCRVRGEVCGDRRLAEQRAAATADLITLEGARVATRVVPVNRPGRADSVRVAIRYRIGPTSTWTVANSGTSGASFELAVEWVTPWGTRTAALGPGERVRAAYIDASVGVPRVTMRILQGNDVGAVEIKANGFAGTPLCEQPRLDGTPFACQADSATGLLRIEPVLFG